MRRIALWSGLVFWGVAPATAADCGEWHREGFFETATLEEVTGCLEAWADPKTRDKDGHTPLHMAVRWSENPAVISALLEAGADPNAGDKGDYTPLHEAARWNDNIAVLATLLEAGANP